jgi:molybdate transport system substrate-binding protein
VKIYSSLCTVFLVMAILFTTYLVVFAQGDDSVTVFAAASLTDAFTEIAEAFEAEYDIPVTLNFAGSTTLVAQLQEGALADVFASANAAQMQNAVDSDLVGVDTVQIFVENQLVLIVPADNPAEIETLQDLAQEGQLIVMASESVPIRVYTDELLALLAEHYNDESFVESVMANVVSEEENVRQVVARVALGEADAAIVYRTDVTPDMAESLLVIELPMWVESPIARYPIAPLVDAPNPDGAALFVEYVLSDAGQTILQKWGFCSPQTEAEMVEATPEVTPETTPDAENEVAPCA